LNENQALVDNGVLAAMANGFFDTSVALQHFDL